MSRVEELADRLRAVEEQQPDSVVDREAKDADARRAAGQICLLVGGLFGLISFWHGVSEGRHLYAFVLQQGLYDLGPVGADPATPDLQMAFLAVHGAQTVGAILFCYGLIHVGSGLLGGAGGYASDPKLPSPDSGEGMPAGRMLDKMFSTYDKLVESALRRID